MDSKLQGIINSNSIHFNAWIDSINLCNEMTFSEKSYTSEESLDITLEAVNTLSKIAELCFKYGGFKDSWKYDKFYQNMYGPELIIDSIKTKTNFKIGINEKGLYINTYFRHTENIKNMDDNFWKELLKLSDFEGFEYDEYEFIRKEVTKKHPELFHSYKGMIFRIFRKYFFGVTEYEDVGDLGGFKITFTRERQFDDIIKDFCLGFKIMYKLNYSLWKIDDLKNKKAVGNKEYK